MTIDTFKRFDAGSTVVRRHVWQGKVWSAVPYRVLHDTGSSETDLRQRKLIGAVEICGSAGGCARVRGLAARRDDPEGECREDRQSGRQRQGTGK